MAKRKRPKATKPPTKSEILSQIAEDAELTRKEVASVFDSLVGWDIALCGHSDILEVSSFRALNGPFKRRVYSTGVDQTYRRYPQVIDSQL